MNIIPVHYSENKFVTVTMVVIFIQHLFSTLQHVINIYDSFVLQVLHFSVPSMKHPHLSTNIALVFSGRAKTQLITLTHIALCQPFLLLKSFHSVRAPPLEEREKQAWFWPEITYHSVHLKKHYQSTKENFHLHFSVMLVSLPKTLKRTLLTFFHPP